MEESLAEIDVLVFFGVLTELLVGWEALVGSRTLAYHSAKVSGISSNSSSGMFSSDTRSIASSIDDRVH